MYKSQFRQNNFCSSAKNTIAMVTVNIGKRKSVLGIIVYLFLITGSETKNAGRRQIMQALIRLLLEEQSDLSLHCLILQ